MAQPYHIKVFWIPLVKAIWLRDALQIAKLTYLKTLKVSNQALINSSYRMNMKQTRYLKKIMLKTRPRSRSYRHHNEFQLRNGQGKKVNKRCRLVTLAIPWVVSVVFAQKADGMKLRQLWKLSLLIMLGILNTKFRYGVTITIRLIQMYIEWYSIKKLLHQ